MIVRLNLGTRKCRILHQSTRNVTSVRGIFWTVCIVFAYTTKYTPDCQSFYTFMATENALFPYMNKGNPYGDKRR